MSAAQVLHAARAAGIRLRAEANDLVLEELWAKVGDGIRR